MMTRLHWLWLTLLSVALALLGAYSAGARKARRAEQVKVMERAAKAAEVVYEVDNEVRRLPDSDVNDRLLERWSRD